MTRFALLNRSLVKALVIPILGLFLVFSTGTAFGQTYSTPGTVSQPQFTQLTTQSIPEMLQQAGYQVTTITNNIGPSWSAMNPQTGKIVNAVPFPANGINITKLTLGAVLPMPGSGLTQQQINDVNAKLPLAYVLFRDPRTNTLLVATTLPFSNSNAQEMKSKIEDLLVKANQAQQILSGNGLAPVNQTTVSVVPVVVSSVANTTWSGTETVSGPLTNVVITFLPGNQVVMTSLGKTYTGTWTQNGSQLSMSFPTINTTFQGSVTNSSFVGQGHDALGTFTIVVTKKF